MRLIRMRVAVDLDFFLFERVPIRVRVPHAVRMFVDVHVHMTAAQSGDDLDAQDDEHEAHAPFEPLLDYHFAVGQKIALAREKNKKELEPPAPTTSPA